MSNLAPSRRRYEFTTRCDSIRELVIEPRGSR